MQSTNNSKKFIQVRYQMQSHWGGKVRLNWIGSALSFIGKETAQILRKAVEVENCMPCGRDHESTNWTESRGSWERVGLNKFRNSALETVVERGPDTITIFFFSAQSLMTLGECCQGYMRNIIPPNLEVGSGMLGRGQGHSESDTGNDRESCFPVQPSLSQDTL